MVPALPVLLVPMAMSMAADRPHVIVGLMRGTPASVELVKRRNRRLAAHPWAWRYDHILFHEGPLVSATQQAVLIADSNLPLKFVAVYEEWRANKARCGAPAKGIYCPQVGGVSCGYKSMCSFWYGGFIKYLNSSYESVLRIDDDCEVDADQPNPMLGLRDVDFAAPLYVRKMDRPAYMEGMVAAFKKFGPSIFGTDASLLVGGKYGEGTNRKHASARDGWNWSPYSNVFWVNLTWARSENITRLLAAVDNTNCIFRARWGDAPLWGGTLVVSEARHAHLPLQYVHGSHGHFHVGGNTGYAGVKAHYWGYDDPDEPKPGTANLSAFYRAYNEAREAGTVIVRATTSAAGNPTGTGSRGDGTRTDTGGGASTVALSSPIGGHASYPAYSASVYHETIKARAAWHHGRGGRTSGGMVSRLTPWDGRTGTYLWDWFPPAFNCPFRERLGRWADGGKIICNWQALDHQDCVVFSFGVGGELTFEEDLAARTRCKIRVYDPTVTGIPSGIASTPCGAAGGSIAFRREGLAVTDGGTLKGYPMKSLATVMREAGYDPETQRIDLLKIDCEGCEFEVIRDLRASGALRRIDQVSMEIHFDQKFTNAPGKSVVDVFHLFEDFEAAGLYPFSSEPNFNTATRNEKPWAIEYMFLRADAHALLRFDAVQRRPIGRKCNFTDWRTAHAKERSYYEYVYG